MSTAGLRWTYLRSSFLALFGAIWALVGTVFLLSGVVPLLAWLGSSAAAPTLQGRVLDRGEDADRDGNVRHWVRFAWSDASGAERTSLADTEATLWSTIHAGDLLALAAPSVAGGPPRLLEPERTATDLLIFAGIGLVVGGVGWTLLGLAFARAGRRARLVATGKLADGTVTSIEEQRNVRMNHRHPLVATFEFKDDSGERRSGRTPFLPRRLEARWTPGAAIRIAYDPLDPSNCEADLFDARAS